MKHLILLADTICYSACSWQLTNDALDSKVAFYSILYVCLSLFWNGMTEKAIAISHEKGLYESFSVFSRYFS